MLKKQQPFQSVSSIKDFEKISIVIPKDIVKKFYDFLIKEKQKEIIVIGFEKGNVPIKYLKEHFKNIFEKTISETFFSIYVYKEIIKNIRNKGLFVNLLNIKPHIEIDLTENLLSYSYELPFYEIIKESVSYIKKIKIPIRKKYKDLDKQAETMIQIEEKNSKKIEAQKINYYDWIKINVSIFDTNENKEVIPDYNVNLWIRISPENIDREIQSLFIGKSKNDSFISNVKCIQQFICPHSFTKYNFLIKIEDHVSNIFFSFDNFKNFFECKDNNDLKDKIIEIFSSRNDISIYRGTCQLLFKSLFDIYKFKISETIIKNFEENILKNIVHNPDYLIYQSDKSFYKNINILACQNTREIILIDYLSFIDKINIKNEDIAWYMNTLQRNRLKDFLYFDNSFLRYQQKETPILHEVIEHIVYREKTLQKRVYNLKNTHGK